jgi:PAS domain S-box-containing protein
MTVFDESLRAVLEASPVPMAVNDGALAITHLNAAFVRTFGYAQADVPTLQDWWRQAYPDGEYRHWVRSSWAQRLEAALREDRPFEALQVEIRAKDGGLRTVLASASPIGATLAGSHLVTLFDITERQRAEDLLRASETRYRLLAENIHDVVWVLDLATRRFSYMSPSVAYLRGYTAEEVMAQPVDAALTPASAAAVHQAIQASHERIAAGGPPVMSHRMELVQPHRDGHLVLTEVVARYLLDDAGRPQALVGVTRDITERKRVQAELERYRLQLEERVAVRTEELLQAKDAAEAANRAKSAFLANMGHELRTPLNAITGFAHLLHGPGLTPAQRNKVEKILDAGRQLSNTVDAVLNLAHIEAGQLELEDAEVDHGQTVAAVAELLAGQAAAKGLQLVADVPPQPLPLSLRGDPLRLKQALLNYAANAIKFTHAGTVVLRTRVDQETADSVWVRFEVTDTGIGIAPEVLPRLFTAFEQADSSLTRPYGGSGVGLVITQRLARLMGGDAGVSSAPGQGSTFWFTARLRKPAAANAGLTAA